MSVVTDEMVNRFLSWKLPDNFAPDNYIHFDAISAIQWTWPFGTNLLTADQARAMLEHVMQSDDFPLGKACDLSGEGTCESCQ